MNKQMNTYRELSKVQDQVIELQKKVNELVHDSLHEDIFVTAAHFKAALMQAMCEMNEAMAKVNI